MLKSMKHHGQNQFTSTPYESYTYDTKSVLFRKGDTLSKTTIQIYKDHLNLVKDISLW